MEFILHLHLKLNDYRVTSFMTCIWSEALHIHPGLPFVPNEEKGRIVKVLEMWINYS